MTIKVFISWAAAVLLLFGNGPAWAAGKMPPAEPRSAPEKRVPKAVKTKRPKPSPKEKAAADAPAASSAHVVYLAERANINDYALFANGSGWDGNWYVGHNTCWIALLPPVPAGNFDRAYLGAKLGRMKTQATPGRPAWERQAIPGEIEIAVNAEAVWPQSRRHLLVKTSALPLEGDPENAVDGVGEARWFWAEIPLKHLSREKNNYVALYSPSENLRDARTSPILAAAWGDTRQNTWLNSSVKGTPPSNAADSLKTAVTYFDPALAIKLVREGEADIDVTILDPVPKSAADAFVLSADVSGENIAAAWVEHSTDEKNWTPAATLWSAPYHFTLKPTALPAGALFFRVAAKDIAENSGVSAAVKITIQPNSSKKQ